MCLRVRVPLCVCMEMKICVHVRACAVCVCVCVRILYCVQHSAPTAARALLGTTWSANTQKQKVNVCVQIQILNKQIHTQTRVNKFTDVI